MEGNQVILLLLKLLGKLASKISNIIGKVGMAYLKHKQRKRELGLKKGKVLKADRAELLIAKSLKKTLAHKDKEFEEKVRVSKFKLDCYKLEMQSELADFEKNIRILKNGLDNAKDQPEKDMMEKQLNIAIKEKTDFEKEVNKTLLDKNKEINKLESEYKHIKENIQICDKAIDGFASNREKDITESTRSNFESLVKEASYSQARESFEQVQEKQPKNDIATDIQNDVSDKHENKEYSTKASFENSVSSEVSTEPLTGIEREVETNSINEVDKKVSLNHEEEPTRSHKDPVKCSKEINKDDEFMKEYLEQQRRKSLSKEHQKDLALER